MVSSSPAMTARPKKGFRYRRREELKKALCPAEMGNNLAIRKSDCHARQGAPPLSPRRGEGEWWSGTGRLFAPPPGRRLFDHLIVAHGGVEADQGRGGLGLDHGPVRILAGEGADGVEGGPPGHHQELDL